MTISTTTLKNAARAIECDLFTDPDGANYLAKDGAILRRWEPETSSADSFELAAVLGISTIYFHGFQEVRAECDNPYKDSTVLYSGDRLKDTRAAILLCASEIGSAL